MKPTVNLLAILGALAALPATDCRVQAGQPASSADQPATNKFGEAIDRMRQRYAGMFEALGFSAAQGDHFIELKMRQFEVNSRVQEIVRARNLAGDSPEVTAMRRKLSADIGAEMNALLGPEGLRIYHSFEVSSAARAAYVEPINGKLTAAGVGLSEPQMEKLAEIFMANNTQVRVKPTDIGMKAVVHWDRVIRDAAGVLTPQQLALLQEFANSVKR